jgi:hypothetical protein
MTEPDSELLKAARSVRPRIRMLPLKAVAVAIAIAAGALGIVAHGFQAL